MLSCTDTHLQLCQSWTGSQKAAPGANNWWGHSHGGGWERRVERRLGRPPDGLFIYIHVYLAAPELSCSRQDLPMFVAACCCCLVAQLCLTLCDLIDCSSPGSSVHGILQARILEWVTISLSRGIFLTQGLNLCLSHCRQTLYRLSHQGSPSSLLAILYSFFKI